MISSDLRLLFNTLSSPVIIHTGKQDKGCKCPLSPTSSITDFISNTKYEYESEKIRTLLEKVCQFLRSK